ncbi:Ig-like domain-containing protein, partial [Spongiivirga sp. MCCC 1A20706]|uniref:Ig-like domain-containing protein n=1 Tax=Spongiivirga sp. MCCC 1A20706 TaxID=3160963 RepID=UPI0039772FCF
SIDPNSFGDPNNPNPGSYTFTYTLTDAETKSRNVTVNQNPIAAIQVDDRTYFTGEDITLNALDNNPNGSSEIKAYSWVVSNGVTSNLAALTTSFDTPGDYDVSLRITYTNSSCFDETSITVSVEQANRPPTAQNVTISFDQNSTNNTIDLNTRIDDPDGDPLTTTIATAPVQGSASINNNVITYTPNNGYIGDDLIEYEVSDGVNPAVSAVISISIDDVNFPPTAQNTSISVDENSADNIIDVSSLINDDDGDPLTLSIAVNSTNGVSTVSGATTILYSPDTDYTGPDSITYQVSDGVNPPVQGVITISVDNVNMPPIANNFTVDVDENSTNNPINLVPNITEPDGDPYTTAIVTAPSNGTASINNNIITYTPNANYDGPDTIVYSVNDSNNPAVNGTISITVNNVNQPPVAQNDDLSITEGNSFGISIFMDNGNGADTDPDGDVFTVDQVNTSAALVGTNTPGNNGGVFNISAAGNLTFNTNGDFEALNNGQTATTQVTYRINDGNGGTDTATIIVTVDGVDPANQAPVAQNDNFSVAENASTLNRNLFNDNGNGVDTDPNGDPFTVDRVNNLGTNIDQQVFGTNGGIFVISANGNMSFNPNGEFDSLNDGETQNTSVTYRINDGTDFSNNATVTITINGVNSTNNPPVANAGPDQPAAPSTLPSFTLNGSGSTDDGTIVSYLWTQIGGPSVTITNPNSNITTVTGYAPSTTYTFELTVTDDGSPALSDTDTVIVTTQALPNTPPIANAGPDQPAVSSGALNFTLNGTGSSDDGTIVSYLWELVGAGSVTITNPNSATTTVTGFTPGESYTFQLTVTDDGSPALSDTDTVTVTIENLPNNAPLANAGPDQPNISSAATSFTLNGTSSTDDGTIVSYLWELVSPGSVTISNPNNATTTVTGFSLGTSYTFQLTVTDNGSPALTDTDTVIITIDPNQDPTAGIRIVSRTGDFAPETITFSGDTSTDPENQSLTYSWDFGDGSPTETGEQVTHVFTDVRSYTITLTINDGNGGIDTTTRTISVAVGVYNSSTGLLRSAPGRRIFIYMNAGGGGSTGGNGNLTAWQNSNGTGFLGNGSLSWSGSGSDTDRFDFIMPSNGQAFFQGQLTAPSGGGSYQIVESATSTTLYITIASGPTGFTIPN